MTKIDKATCNNIINQLVNKNKRIKIKYAKRISLVYPGITSANNKFDKGKKNFQVEVMTLKKFVLSKHCLLKEESKTFATSKDVYMGSGNFLDPANALANKHLIKNLEKEAVWQP